MENKKIENLGIGKEQEKLKATKITVVDYRIETVELEKDKAEKLVLVCRHPDTESFLEISRIKYEANKKVKYAGSWVTLDKEGLLPYNSAVSIMLRYYNLKNIKGLLGKDLETSPDENGFLVIKAY